MNKFTAEKLRTLVTLRKTAALGTLHLGEPWVSMVPFVYDATRKSVLIHVSQLSSHTGDMLENSRVSLMIADDETAHEPQALPRATLNGIAEPLDPEGELYAAGKALYLKRFPNASVGFELPDFLLFEIEFDGARVIGGFAQAYSLDRETLLNALP